MPSLSILQERLQSIAARRTVQAVAIVVVLLGVAAAAHRAHHNRHVPGPFDAELKHTGFIDFQNGIYFPSLAFGNGVSPYSAEYAEQYPVPRPTPAYSPLNFVYHLPFTWLPLPVAEWVYFVTIVGLAIAFVWLLLKDADASVGIWLCPLLAVLVWSRAGHATLFGGYFTLELALATMAALHFARSRPWIAAVGVAIASVKPTY
ncbi:MAG: glycosyltransferase 87 family protein, partial [Aeoliella sp.]